MFALTSYIKPLRMSYRSRILLIFTIVVLDAVSTVWLMSHGFGEANPIMAWIADATSPSIMAIIKIIFSLVLIVWLIPKEKFDKYVNYLIICYISIYILGWWLQIL